MGFLDNSGDIILDAVLTDTGRMRMAKGDGSFKITKYAFADDEIDYSKYNNEHTSGSAYYDLDILKTPVLEAFTNNGSSMKHKLISIPRTNLLYLPVMRLQDTANDDANGHAPNSTAGEANGMFAVLVDENTETLWANNSTTYSDQGVLFGATNNKQKHVQIDQGLDTANISKFFALDPDLVETRFLVEIDNRLGTVKNKEGTVQTPNFIDDDNIATYNFVQNGGNGGMVGSIGISGQDTDNITPASVLDGPRGNKFKFTLGPSLELNSSTYLFTTLGSSGNNWGSNSESLYYIDTTVRVVGATTGYRLDIPIRFVKKA